MSMHSKLQNGVTLIELVLSIVVISIALTGILTVMNFTVRHSADPIIQHQAIAIAESYLEEILLQAYEAGGYSGTDRSKFDDVDDYNALADLKVRDQQGNELTAFSDYTVTVLVSAPTTLTGNVLAKKITVTVSGAANTSIQLLGYRAKIPND